RHATRQQADPTARLLRMPRWLGLPMRRRGAPVEDLRRGHRQPGVGGARDLRRSFAARRELGRIETDDRRVDVRPNGARALRAAATPPRADRPRLDDGRSLGFEASPIPWLLRVVSASTGRNTARVGLVVCLLWVTLVIQ